MQPYPSPRTATIQLRNGARSPAVSQAGHGRLLPGPVIRPMSATTGQGGGQWSDLHQGSARTRGSSSRALRGVVRRCGAGAARARVVQCPPGRASCGPRGRPSGPGALWATRCPQGTVPACGGQGTGGAAAMGVRLERVAGLSPATRDRAPQARGSMAGETGNSPAPGRHQRRIFGTSSRLPHSVRRGGCLCGPCGAVRARSRTVWCARAARP
jgi:hypothetical protein